MSRNEGFCRLPLPVHNKDSDGTSRTSPPSYNSHDPFSESNSTDRSDIPIARATPAGSTRSYMLRRQYENIELQDFSSTSRSQQQHDSAPRTDPESTLPMNAEAVIRGAKAARKDAMSFGTFTKCLLLIPLLLCGIVGSAAYCNRPRHLENGGYAGGVWLHDAAGPRRNWTDPLRNWREVVFLSVDSKAMRMMLIEWVALAMSLAVIILWLYCGIYWSIRSVRARTFTLLLGVPCVVVVCGVMQGVIMYQWLLG